ncbi:hypothetical protein J6590_088612 [Homalodisca vitripennis]|nr:hypothetical protein J6590_088612 [Homalodisca vitripennis]
MGRSLPIIHHLWTCCVPDWQPVAVKYLLASGGKACNIPHGPPTLPSLHLNNNMPLSFSSTIGDLISDFTLFKAEKLHSAVQFVIGKAKLEMETLPAEVVEMIALFLSIKDLKACCGTTHTWRDIFGQDTIWKRHCNRALAKCLGAAQSRVEPKFVLSEEEHLKNLSPLGEWRQAYLQEQLLWSHWRNGNYVMEELTIKSSYKYIAWTNSNETFPVPLVIDFANAQPIKEI